MNGVWSVFTKGIADEGWGLLTTLAIPEGGELGLYEPRHVRPVSPA